ncbi:hypothetical protein IFU02_002725 (plasmid) [Pantoea agglomerans]|uniref:hypothetical protein n=1 Tax=Enterobacterales TaxID=91347 RepID=UPI00177D20E8|nr:hypothetical protein [Pantoea agglomerans]MBD8234747.1 hypothetical protein [Pantoea agglomerans]WVL83448.1 hypothetical protein IFU02_002725 [Pantoea agglomerans]
MLPQLQHTGFTQMLVYPCRKNSATNETDALQITMTHDKMVEINLLLTEAGVARKPKITLPGENVMLVVLDASKFLYIAARLVLTLDDELLKGWFAELQDKGIKKVIVRTNDTRTKPE